GILGESKDANSFISKYINLTFRFQSPVASAFSASTKPAILEVSSIVSKNQKKRGKSLALLGESGLVGTIKSKSERQVCECLATKHSLLTNCLNCGKIVCDIEGPGPCTSCGTLVESKDQQLNLLNEQKRKHKVVTQPHTYGQKAGSMRANADPSLFPVLGDDESREKAEKQKNRLIGYDRNSVARTKVHDNASDFDYHSSASNKWLTKEQRAQALLRATQLAHEEAEHRKHRVITIDILNSRVLDTIQKPTRERVMLAPEPLDVLAAESGSGNFKNPNLKRAAVFVDTKVVIGETKLTILQKRKLENVKIDSSVKIREPVKPARKLKSQL
ncbi:Activating signal cointegrator 1, partial [Nowakowskiella sp. JEL0078]